MSPSLVVSVLSAFPPTTWSTIHVVGFCQTRFSCFSFTLWDLWFVVGHVALCFRLGRRLKKSILFSSVEELRSVESSMEASLNLIVVSWITEGQEWHKRSIMRSMGTWKTGEHIKFRTLSLLYDLTWFLVELLPFPATLFNDQCHYIWTFNICVWWWIITYLPSANP